MDDEQKECSHECSFSKKQNQFIRKFENAMYSDNGQKSCVDNLNSIAVVEIMLTQEAIPVTRASVAITFSGEVGLIGKFYHRS